MLYLICYDIEDNYLRTKVANKLIDYGFYRIQYSVFMGTIKKRHFKELTKILKKIEKKLKKDTESIIILNIFESQLEKSIIFGDKLFDIEEILGIKHTLYFR